MKKTVFNRFAKVRFADLAPFSKNGWLYMFDQKSEAIYSEKLDLEDGYYELPIENQFVKVSDLTKDTPDWTSHFVCSDPVKVSKSDMEIIKLVSTQSGNNDLRPMMKAVCVENKTAVATNGHTMVFMDVETDLNTNFEFQPFIPIQDCAVAMSTIESNNWKKRYVVFLYDKIQIAIPETDGKFLNWKSVIPTQENPKGVRITRKQMNEIIQFQKTFNCHAAAISKNKLTIFNEDITFSKTWEIEDCVVQVSKPCGLIMPMLIPAGYEIGFTINNLHRVMLDADNIVLSYVEENRAAMVSHHYNAKPKSEATEPKQEPFKKTRPEKKTNAVTEIKILRYSEKSIVLTGEGTRAIKEELIKAGGKYNPFLKDGEKTFKGWIFSVKKEEVVKTLVNA